MVAAGGYILRGENERIAPGQVAIHPKRGGLVNWVDVFIAANIIIDRFGQLHCIAGLTGI